MKLEKITLHNFRCFGNEETAIRFDNITTLIGNNSSGKTAVLAALNCLLNNRSVVRSDFHVPKGTTLEKLKNQNLFIEAKFTFPELNEDNPSDIAIAPFFKSFVVSKPDEDPYMRLRLNATWEESCDPEGSISANINYILCPEGEEIKESAICIARSADLSRIKFLYIPAIRDSAGQIKNTPTSLMGRLLTGINWSDETKAAIKAKSEELNQQFLQERGAQIVSATIDETWKRFDFDTRFTNAKLSFTVDDLIGSIKKSEIKFFPNENGRESSIHDIGDGLKSLFYISLAGSVLHLESQLANTPQQENDPFSKRLPALTILAVEEPENHIAPHILGRIVESLESVALESNAQVILTTHSPSIVKRINPQDIRYLRFNPASGFSEAKCLSLPDEEHSATQFKYIKGAVTAYPELYFANLVVLGEGESEEIILPRVLKAKIGANVDTSGISIVPLGGRHVNHLWRLLHDLDIPHITLLDLDLGRHGGGWGRIKYAIDQLTLYGTSEQALLPSGERTFQDMLNWDNHDKERMQKWITQLEKFGIYFSNPLDIDFMMLEACLNIYKDTLSEREGPQEATLSNLEVETQKALKSEKADTTLYTSKQKGLMPWYVYFFLGRGKPTSHLMAFSGLSEAELLEIVPPVLDALSNAVKTVLSACEKP